jgi:hypothetical protein
MDETITCFQASIDVFCLFVETISNEKECGNDIHEPMLHFGNNVFSKYNEKMQHDVKLVYKNREFILMGRFGYRIW